MASGGSEEKSLPASAKKLREARKKGQVPKSKDFVGAFVTMAAVGYVVIRMPVIAAQFGALLDLAGRTDDIDVATARVELLSGLAHFFVLSVVPLLALLVLVAVATSVIAMGGPLIAMDPLMPKLAKLNPAQGFMNLVSAKGLIELGKSLLKFGCLLAISWTVIRGSLQTLVELPTCGLDCSAPILRDTMLPLAAAAVIVFLVFGVADLLLQRWLFARDQRMSFTERKNEHKNSEGNPLIKGAHKRERREAAKLRAGLREATFVISGSQVAVALRFSAIDTRVPTPVARAEADDVIGFIQDARKLKLPMIHDPAAARAVFDKGLIGKSIPRDLFNPVIGCMKRLGVL